MRQYLVHSKYHNTETLQAGNSKRNTWACRWSDGLTVGSKRVSYLCNIQQTRRPKIVEECTYPLTAPRCVDRIYTNLAIIDVTDEGLVVKELAPGVTFEYVQECTAAPLKLHVDVQSETVGVQ